MTARSWSSTVTIEIKGERTTFAHLTTTRDAASYLVDRWPGRLDDAYKDAIVVCTRALRGEVDDRLALAGFIRAATVSGLRYVNKPDSDYGFESALIEATKQSLADDMSGLRLSN